MGGEIDQAAAAVAAAKRVVVLTGAGVSAESEIPTFRDTMDGLWKEFDPQTLATPEAFARDPKSVSKWYDWRRQRCLEAEPNPGHRALADLEQDLESRGRSLTILTQNVDRLHQKAGSGSVVELHGTIMIWRCTQTGREIEPGPEPFDRFPPVSPFAGGALLRPCVVWFGEALPPEALDAAQRAVDECDVFLSIGTSSVVYPAAGFVQVASSRGATTIEVNPETTPITELVDVHLRGRSGEILPELLRAFRAIRTKG